MKKNKAYRERLKQKKAQKRRTKDKAREKIRLKHIEDRNEMIAAKKAEIMKQWMAEAMKRFEADSA